MNDLVQRLREWCQIDDDLQSRDLRLWREAADEIERLRAELAQRGEPVAWIKDTSLRALQRDESTVLAYPHDYLIRPAVPLYTAPPQCQPLSEEQLELVLRRDAEGPLFVLMHIDERTTVREIRQAITLLARAVERAHGIVEEHA